MMLLASRPQQSRVQMQALSLGSYLVEARPMIDRSDSSFARREIRYW